VNRGVIYLNHGTKHCARLAVSLYSLRKVYGGPIVVMDTGEESAKGIVAKIASETRLNVTVQPIPFTRLRRHSCYVAKPSLWRYSPFETTLLLDADTVVVKEPSKLFELAEQESDGLVVTRFSNWDTQGKIVSGRIEQWRGIKDSKLDVPHMIVRARGTPQGAVNTGVVCWRKGSPFLPAWERLSKAGSKCSLTDEVCCQLLLTQFKHAMVDCRYNASPLYPACSPEHVVIWHFHGNKQCRAEALPFWWPVYAECMEQNIAGIMEWTPAGDERLGKYLEQRDD
jgi:lipopolysaccharide biosynthesis glycosyltransferase